MREYLQSLRTEMNLSQQTVADKIDKSRQYYSLIENGERQQSMDISILTGLSKVFSIPIEKLVELETEYSERSKP